MSTLSIYNIDIDNNTNTDKCLSIDNCRDNNLRVRAREENFTPPVAECNQPVTNCDHFATDFDPSLEAPHFDSELDCLDLSVFSNFDFEEDSGQSAYCEKEDTRLEYDEAYYQTINDSMPLVEEYPKEPRKWGLEREEFLMTDYSQTEKSDAKTPFKTRNLPIKKRNLSYNLKSFKFLNFSCVFYQRQKTT